jgi:hypothetical protein
VLRRGALLLVGAVLGAAVALAILAAVIPARLFGVSDNALEYSISPGGSVSCDRVGRVRWRCDLFDGGESLTYTYSVVVSPGGCWEARSQAAQPLDGCLGLRDYVRLMDR